MLGNFILFYFILGSWAYAPLREPALYNNDASFIQDVMDRITRDMDQDNGPYVDLGNKMDDMSGSFLPGRATKDAEFMDSGDYDMLMGSGGHPSIRDQEFLQHSSLWGHKYITGGGSEVKQPYQKVKGQTSASPVKSAAIEVKTDAILPAYCNPPNPCPVGYSADDGCIETFENTAAFSRAYQGSQDCMCDTEHMFDCPAAEREPEIELDHDFLNSISVEGSHKGLVAKKFYTQKVQIKKAHDQKLSRLNEMVHEAAAAHDNGEGNPFLQGEKLPVAAKKGNTNNAHHN